MKCFYVLAAVVALGLATEGCKKREPKPAPQVVDTALPASAALRKVAAMPAARPSGAGAPSPAIPSPSSAPDPRNANHKPNGIAWFQGSLEEGFSRTATAQAGAPARQACLQPLAGDADCHASAWARSMRILSRLIQSARLGL